MLLLLAFISCSIDNGPPCEPTPHRLDDTLRMNHVQAIGTHNSYHVDANEGLIAEWAYTHPRIYEQLVDQGVRQLELDLLFSEFDQRFAVIHVPLLDPGTNCEWLSDCLAEVSGFSADFPAHHPVVILLEIKNDFEEDEILQRLSDLESVVTEVLGEERLITPDLVQGEHDSLNDAISTTGWPTLGDTRGKTMVVLHANSVLRGLYTEGETTTRGRVMFPDSYGNIDWPVSAFHSWNDPTNGNMLFNITTIVEAGHMVRTRADADLQEPRALDYSRFEAALSSGAHLISTDLPVPTEGFDYVAQIPDGTPSRCNPVTAPAECTSSDVEDPEKLFSCESE
jgi:hypothetical protein